MLAKLNKRGISPVIATVLLILLTVLAVTMLTGFIIPFIKGNLQKSTECVGSDENFKFDENFDYNCKLFSGTGANITMSVSRTSEESKNIGGFVLTFQGNGASKTVQVIDGSETSTAQNGVSMLNPLQSKIDIPANGETRSFIFYADTPIYTKVELRSILKSGKVCEKVSDIIELTGC